MASSSGSSDSGSWDENTSVSNSSRHSDVNVSASEGNEEYSSEVTDEYHPENEELPDRLSSSVSSSPRSRTSGISDVSKHGTEFDDVSGRSIQQDESNVDNVIGRAQENRLVQFGFNQPDRDEYGRLGVPGQVKLLLASFRHFLRKSQARSGAHAALPTRQECGMFLRVHPEYAARFEQIRTALRSNLPQTFGASRGGLAEMVEAFFFEGDNIMRLGYGATQRRRDHDHNLSGTGQGTRSGEFYDCSVLI